ncbi:FliI/YscN family ATPase [Trinickia caryophylli]|nr:FliI/YscN family ATPase [Trinickia caryophylli]TRX20223.1 FliI/YscN family ATPase [Trinickia caryophylli]
MHGIDARLAAWTNAARARLAAPALAEAYGHVERVSATLIGARLADCTIGHLCEIGHPHRNARPTLAEVVGFDGAHVLLAPLGCTQGLSPGTPVRSLGRGHELAVGAHLLGEVLDGLGRPLDPLDPADPRRVDAPAAQCRRQAVLAAPPPPTGRPRIADKLVTGVRAIDALATLGRGQRIALLAGPGAGKTTLLGALARGTAADVVVLALVGERGRELNEFLERELDRSRLARTVVVWTGADAAAIERVRAPFTATAIAEGFRAAGQHVLLLVDSLTRVARAQREIGLAAGEPPGRLGFPPSVYAMLPRLTERAGLTRDGSITAIYTVLTESDTGDPIAEEARSLLDGHIVLSRALVERGHFPPIDVLASLSRTMHAVVDDVHRSQAARLRDLLARHRDLELLIALGEFQTGFDADNDEAVARHARIAAFLRQDLRVASSWLQTMEQLNATVHG